MTNQSPPTVNLLTQKGQLALISSVNNIPNHRRQEIHSLFHALAVRVHPTGMVDTDNKVNSKAAPAHAKERATQNKTSTPDGAYTNTTGNSYVPPTRNTTQKLRAELAQQSLRKPAIKATTEPKNPRPRKHKITTKEHDEMKKEMLQAAGISSINVRTNAPATPAAIPVMAAGKANCTVNKAYPKF